MDYLDHPAICLCSFVISVQLDVEKPDKITDVACDHDRVIFERVVPNFRVTAESQRQMNKNFSGHGWTILQPQLHGLSFSCDCEICYGGLNT